jgi:hypothetical protein
MSPALRTEPVGAREEVRLEDRFQHELQGRLRDPVPDGRDPEARRLAVPGFGIIRSRTCALLAKDPSMIASFSRALLEGLTDEQADGEFNATLEASVAQIYDCGCPKPRAGLLTW